MAAKVAQIEDGSAEEMKKAKATAWSFFLWRVGNRSVTIAVRQIAGADGHFLLFGVGEGALNVMIDVSAPPATEPIERNPLLPKTIQNELFLRAVLSDGRTVASVGNDGRLRVYDRLSHDVTLDTHLPGLYGAQWTGLYGAQLHFTADGRGLAVTHQNGVVYLLRLPDAGKATPPPLDPDWLKRVQTLRARNN